MAAQRISLSKMLAQWETAVHHGRPSCNVHGFYQPLDQITRAKYNRIKNETTVSCIDHMNSYTRYKVTNLSHLVAATMMLLCLPDYPENQNHL